MADTISEQIVQAIVTALKTIQRPTYAISVGVERVKVYGSRKTDTNKDAMIEVVSRAPTRDYSSGYGNRAFYNMLVGVWLDLDVSSRDTEPTDALQAVALAEVTKVIEANRQWGGLAADSIITAPKFGYDEAIPGSDLMIDINFFCSATNPYSLT